MNIPMPALGLARISGEACINSKSVQAGPAHALFYRNSSEHVCMEKWNSTGLLREEQLTATARYTVWRGVCIQPKPSGVPGCLATPVLTCPSFPTSVILTMSSCSLLIF